MYGTCKDISDASAVKIIGGARVGARVSARERAGGGVWWGVGGGVNAMRTRISHAHQHVTVFALCARIS